eukprot:Unigene2523_Nuclearia_a/m.7807 Unigene2523_Nuclearia_a/g.7807  ORF Unigene2523_Nuclearia_a/g.7807 Unigene2523_Nuclearia_a/m.7807 type:complete len:293 (-) Unigene2523_Nuclearia_a:40-918(-)
MITQLIGHLPFWQIYGILLVAGSMFILVLSFPLYLPLYKWQPSKDTAARWKTILRYPSDETVNREIRWAFIGLSAGILNPALSTYLAHRKLNMMYSDISEHGYGWWATSFVLLFFYNEIFQYTWHRMCHTYPLLWNIHKVHHKFHNPSPISVISNHPLDLIVQASPLFVVPFLFPIHDLTLFLTYAIMNYGYGAYLHSGFDWPLETTSPHHWLLITNYHHVMHHAKSQFGKPLNTGFFLNIFDKLGGTFAGPEYFAKEGVACVCAHCRPKDAHLDALAASNAPPHAEHAHEE